MNNPDQPTCANCGLYTNGRRYCDDCEQEYADHQIDAERDARAEREAEGDAA